MNNLPRFGLPPEGREREEDHSDHSGFVTNLITHRALETELESNKAEREGESRPSDGAFSELKGQLIGTKPVLFDSLFSVA